LEQITDMRDDLLDQYNRACQMFYTILEQTPEDKWNAGPDPYSTPAVLAYHTIECLDYYAWDQSRAPYPNWGYRFGKPWWEMSPEEMPRKAELVAYLKEIQASTVRQFELMTDADLAAPHLPEEGSGKTVLGHWIYALRHTMHHQGALAAVLLSFGITYDSWA